MLVSGVLLVLAAGFKVNLVDRCDWVPLGQPWEQFDRSVREARVLIREVWNFGEDYSKELPGFLNVVDCLIEGYVYTKRYLEDRCDLWPIAEAR